MTETGNPDALAHVRVRRDELYDAMLALERAVSVPARGRVATWAAAVHDRLQKLAGAWSDHIAGTEAEDGLFAQILDREPRLAHAVDGLRADHAAVTDAFTAADARVAAASDDATVEEIRSALLALIHAMFEHRSRGAELVYEAYDVDLSAGD